MRVPYLRSGGPHYQFVVDVKSALHRGELTEPDFELVKNTKVPGYAELAAAGKITLPVMYSAVDFENWKAAYVTAHLAPEGRNVGDLVCMLSEVLPGALSLGAYEFPVLKIHKDTSLDVVVDIFEGMNRRGQKLDQFDLMVARLYRELPDGSRYDLRAAWESMLEQTSDLPAVGVDLDDGMLPLKLIAKRLSRLDDAIRPPGVKGLNNKDVLYIPPEQIIGATDAPDPSLSLQVAVQALEDAARFLRTVCGVRSKDLLPQKSMLLPLADQFVRPASERVPDEQLKRWFAAVGLSGHYYGSVNSYADSDCDDLHRWASDTGATPQDVSSVNRAFIEGIDLRQACTRDGRILGVTVMSLLVAGGARDWVPSGLSIATRPDAVELHHVVPKRRLNAMLPKTVTRDPIAGLTPLTNTANSRASDKQPSEVMDDLGPDANPILTTHYINRAQMEGGYNTVSDFEAFLDSRAAALKAFIIATLGL